MTDSLYEVTDSLYEVTDSLYDENRAVTDSLYGVTDSLYEETRAVIDSLYARCVLQGRHSWSKMELFEDCKKCLWTPSGSVKTTSCKIRPIKVLPKIPGPAPGL